MGFFDGVASIASNLNPMTHTASMMKWAIVAGIILALFFMIWVTVLAKTGLTGGKLPTVSSTDRLFGVARKNPVEGR